MKQWKKQSNLLRNLVLVQLASVKCLTQVRSVTSYKKQLNKEWSLYQCVNLTQWLCHLVVQNHTSVLTQLPLVHREKMDKQDRKSTRLNSSHVSISYAVFCLRNKYI